MSNLTESVKQFQEQGYLIVTNLMKTQKIYPKLMEYAKNNKAILDDSQCVGTPSFYNSTIGNELHDKLHKEIEKWTGLELYKTHNYWRKYRKGDILLPHIDRPACEINVSLCIGFKGNPWELFILNKDGIPIRTFLNPGDALLYKGCEQSHWRPRLKESDEHIQIFLHYVDQSGPYKDLQYDQKA